MKQRMKPYGRLITQGKEFLLLNPQPIPNDSCWDNGTYLFFVAVSSGPGAGLPLQIITNSFLIIYSNHIEEIELEGTALPEKQDFFDPLLPPEEEGVSKEDEEYYQKMEGRYA